MSTMGWAAVGWALGGSLLGAGAARWACARRVARARAEFAAGMSHDLRTPLAQIQLYTEMLLLRRDRSEEERAEWLQVIERETHALGGRIDNLLLLADPPDGDAYPAREPLDLGTLVEDVAAVHAERAAAEGMRIVADPPPGVVVEADPRALRQTVANLLDNALRFGPAGQEVVLSVHARDGHAELSVRDRGPGLPARERARLRAPDRARWRGGGDGLGLAVVAHVVRAHGGEAAAEEASGGGACVRIVLPLAEPRACA